MTPLYWRNEGEENFPEHGSEMYKSFRGIRLTYNHVIIVDDRTEHTGLDELILPAGLLLLSYIIVNQVKLLLFEDLIDLSISDFDSAAVLLRNFDTSWLSLFNDNFELGTEIIFVITLLLLLALIGHF